MHLFLKTWLIYALAASPVLAQNTTPSRIERVTLYAGSAEVTRVATAPSGSAYLHFDCIPKTFAVDSVRAMASPATRIGDLRIDPVSATRVKACHHSPEQDRVRALEDQRAAIAAEKEANDQVADYIKARSAATEKQNAPDGKAFNAFVDSLRQTAQSTFAKRQELDRKLEDLDVELQTARQERDRVVGSAQEFVSVRVAVQAKSADEVRLSYDTSRAGWGASYRATLDSLAGTVTLERNALVAQNTGEPWAGVHVTLSTGQPTRSSPSGPAPVPRQLSYRGPEATQQVMGRNAPMPSPPAPALMAPSAQRALLKEAQDSPPLFDVNAFQGTYATSFELDGPVTLPADGQKATLSLGVQIIHAKLLAQSVPDSGDTGAYVIANAEPLAGIWPRGNLQLVRDGVTIGMLPNWQAQSNDPFSMSFGRDELILVSVDPSVNTSAGSGFFGDSVKRELHAHYTVSNRHTAAVDIELLEAAPVSNNDKITVVSQFLPAPSTLDWHKRPGVIAWDARLEAGATAEFRADYLVTGPKEGTILGL